MSENGGWVGGKPTYLFTDRSRHRHRKWTDISAAQVLPFALVTEELQFAFFLVIQAVAVTYLEPKMTTRIQVKSDGKVNRSRLRYRRQKKASLCFDVGKLYSVRWAFPNDSQRGIKTCRDSFFNQPLIKYVIFPSKKLR